MVIDKNNVADKGGTSLWEISFKRLVKNKLAVFGFVVLMLLIVVSVLAPLIAPYDRDATDLKALYNSPSGEHWLGTDELGRDTFTRLVYGGRVSLMVGLVSTSISITIGIVLGSVAGFFGKKADTVIMRIVDMFMCFPFYVIAITMAAILGPSIWNVMIISGVLGWTSIARLVRAEIMTIKQREFIEAARALGLNSREIIVRHMLPNILSVIVVYATLGIANGILTEAGLSFLGLGVKQPQPSWGNMLSAAQSLKALNNYWWLWVPPGILVCVTVLSINFLGDGLRDALDPKLKR